jgi:hypothetical protein
LRALRAEGNTPLEDDAEEAVLRYEVTRRENKRFGEEIGLLKKTVEELCQAPPPSPPKKRSPEEKRKKEKEKRGREKRRVISFFSSSPDFSPMRSPLKKMISGVAYRNDDHPVMRLVIMGVWRRLDVKESPSETPVPTVVLPT